MMMSSTSPTDKGASSSGGQQHHHRAAPRRHRNTSAKPDIHNELKQHRAKRLTQLYGTPQNQSSPSAPTGTLPKKDSPRKDSQNSFLSRSVHSWTSESKTSPRPKNVYGFDRQGLYDSEQSLVSKEVSISREMLNEFQECFAYHDEQRSGLVDLHHFRQIISSLGYLLQEDELRSIERIVDSNFGGLLSFGNFCKLMLTMVIPMVKKKEDGPAKVKDAFRRYNKLFYDMYSDQIAVGDLETLMMRRGDHPLDPTSFRALLDSVNVDDDYTVNAESLVNVVQGIYGFNPSDETAASEPEIPAQS